MGLLRPSFYRTGIRPPWSGGRAGSPLKKSDCRRLLKNDDMQGAQFRRNEAYIEVRRSDEG